MKITQKAMFWAVAIIMAAVYSNEAGLSDGASFGITMALTGAAMGSLSSRRIAGKGGCKTGCS